MTSNQTIKVFRFSIQRLPALTLSHFKSHADSGRSSFLDTPSQVEMDVLEVGSLNLLFMDLFNFLSNEICF